MHKVAGSTVDWTALRDDFPILGEQAHGYPLIYFDNAATSQKPRAVIKALQHFYEHANANVHRGLHTLSSRATERTKKRVNALRRTSVRPAQTKSFSHAEPLRASIWWPRHGLGNLFVKETSFS